MNQRKSNSLFLQPSKPIPNQPTTKHPLTPYPMSVTQERVLKKRKIIGDEEILSTQPSLMSFPLFNSAYSLSGLRCNITPAEFIRASESVLKQVNWSKVVLDAIGEDKPVLYRNAFEKILRAQIEELLKQEECKENKHIEYNQKTEKNRDIVGNKESAARAGDNLEYLDDKIFIGSDQESEYESGGYEDEDDDDDEDDEDDEDDYKDSDDGVSVQQSR